MDLQHFLFVNGLQKPLIAIQGDIFSTPADHIAFAVHWRNKAGYLDNSNGGFAGQVAKYGWPELATLEFEKGKPVTKRIKGKYFHALPVHTNETGGWDETPSLIEECLNILPVPSTEVIACVLIGGGHAGIKYKATVNNIEGLIKTYKTTVLYVYDEVMYNALVGTGVVASAIPLDCALTQLPKVYKYRELQTAKVLELMSS